MGVTPVVIVALSGGKDSTAMALRLRELHADIPFRFVCTPTGNELPDMIEHWARLERLLDTPLEVLPNRSLEDLMGAQEALPSTRMRWCTRMIKIAPVLAFYKTLPAGSIACVGLRADEEEREGIFGSSVQQAFPLRDWGWGLADVQGYLKARGVCVPARTDCAWCPFQGADDWFRLWRDHPDFYARGEAWEERLGRTFRNPKAKLGTWAASLRAMRAQFEAGKVTREESKRRLAVLKNSDPEEAACRVCRM